VFSAAKLLLAYGLGQGLTFPSRRGDRGVMAERPHPGGGVRAAAPPPAERFSRVPTRYAAMWPARAAATRAMSCAAALRRRGAARADRQNAGPALGGRHPRRIGSTAMLHISVQLPGDVRYGTPANRCKVTGCAGRGKRKTRWRAASPGELQVAGPPPKVFCAQRVTGTIARKPAATSGDREPAAATRLEGRDGYFVYGRAQRDMLKVSGIYVSPIEGESA